MAIQESIDGSSPVSVLPRVGAVQKDKLAKLDVHTVGDLLRFIPRRYDDTRDVTPLSQVRPGEMATVRVRVQYATASVTKTKRIPLTQAKLEDDGATVEAVWLNQRFLAEKFRPGTELLLSGRARVDRYGKISFTNPKWEITAGSHVHVGVLAPVYPETHGLSSRYLRSIIEPNLHLASMLDDVLPPAIRTDEHLLDFSDAIISIHHPESDAMAKRGIERVAFEELFLLQLAAERARRKRMSAIGVAIPYDIDVAKQFARSLPFALTNAQRVAAHEILNDMADSGPMNRLLQGDVGSGKTVVAAMAARMAHAAGFQTVVMAPTEILARQHHQTLSGILEPHGMHTRLLVGATGQKSRREIFDGLVSGHDPIVVGTHALLEDDVRFANLGLAIVDEQHRFGVAQRQKLRQKAQSVVNFLSMTATPIPRTLTLTLYGDVNLSEIREMPAGRMPITTRVVSPPEREGAYTFIRDQVKEGRQVFVICPLIEESDKLGAKSATAEYERLRKDVFADLRVELLHGRMPAKEKEERMARFAEGRADILVATSVVEVGVDVPNATVMLIESAERFGIAQLHQFRGRVGRGQHQSHCLLFMSAGEQEATLALNAMARTNSGFELAELDLRIRGGGDVGGLRQHGLPEMRAADLLDMALLQRARHAASRWLDGDPDLVAYAPLSKRMNDYRAVFDLD